MCCFQSYVEHSSPVIIIFYKWSVVFVFFYYTPVYLLIFCTDIFISRYIYIFEYTHFATFCTFNMLHISALNSLCFYNMFFRLINSKWRRETSCHSIYVKNGSTYKEMGYRTQPPILRYTQVTVWPSGQIARSLSGR